jgi:hypothetical protein
MAKPRCYFCSAILQYSKNDYSFYCKTCNHICKQNNLLGLRFETSIYDIAFIIFLLNNNTKLCFSLDDKTIWMVDKDHNILDCYVPDWFKPTSLQDTIDKILIYNLFS